MTGKCPHGFASSQGTRQTNNVSKHKREEGRERERGGGGKKVLTLKQSETSICLLRFWIDGLKYSSELDKTLSFSNLEYLRSVLKPPRAGTYLFHVSSIQAKLSAVMI